MLPLKEDGVVWGYDLQYMFTGQLNRHPREAIDFTTQNRRDYAEFYKSLLDNDWSGIKLKNIPLKQEKPDGRPLKASIRFYCVVSDDGADILYPYWTLFFLNAVGSLNRLFFSDCDLLHNKRKYFFLTDV